MTLVQTSLCCSRAPSNRDLNPDLSCKDSVRSDKHPAVHSLQTHFIYSSLPSCGLISASPSPSVYVGTTSGFPLLPLCTSSFSVSLLSSSELQSVAYHSCNSSVVILRFPSSLPLTACLSVSPSLPFQSLSRRCLLMSSQIKIQRQP